jgi:hypothetical protein
MVARLFGQMWTAMGNSKIAASIRILSPTVLTPDLKNVL